MGSEVLLFMKQGDVSSWNTQTVFGAMRTAIAGAASTGYQNV